MGFLGALGSGLSKFGALAGQALKPLGGIAKPVAAAVGAAANTFLPGAVGQAVSGVANKVADFISSGKAADVAGKIGAAGMALTGAALGGPPRAMEG